jgi:hypothetical protein
VAKAYLESAFPLRIVTPGPMPKVQLDVWAILVVGLQPVRCH